MNGSPKKRVNDSNGRPCLFGLALRLVAHLLQTRLVVSWPKQALGVGPSLKRFRLPINKQINVDETNLKLIVGFCSFKRFLFSINKANCEKQAKTNNQNNRLNSRLNSRLHKSQQKHPPSQLPCVSCARCTQATDSAALSPSSWKIFWASRFFRILGHHLCCLPSPISKGLINLWGCNKWLRW